MVEKEAISTDPRDTSGYDLANHGTGHPCNRHYHNCSPLGGAHWPVSSDDQDTLPSYLEGRCPLDVSITDLMLTD